MKMEKVVSDVELKAVMVKIRDLRAWAVRMNIDPWALRQGLLMALEMDTAAASERGVAKADLDLFDNLVKADIRGWLSEKSGRW